ncbi:MAG: YebC/PmpR family DNA-binding transcriptional regulator [Candidatus Hydrogenedentota bacterium]
MSGHSKWSTIKRKKAAVDQKRGKIFSRLAKEITVAAKMGGGDADMNPRLRTALLAAKSANMPSDNIDRAIKKGTGELPGMSYDEVRYEGYGPAGVAFIVDVLTDNKNRTVAEIRHLFTKYGGSLAETNAVAWNFEHKGLVYVPKDGLSDEDVFEKAIEAGADDVDIEGEESYEIQTQPTELHTVATALEEMGLKVEEARLTMLPKTTTEIEVKTVPTVMKLIEALEDHDDVQDVYNNLELTDEAMAALAE